jgi:microcystin-dependent protein
MGVGIALMSQNIVKELRTYLLKTKNNMEQYIGQIQQFPYNFPPRGWTFCHGQLLDINHYTALFSLLGTTYGGDGIRNFALPDLRPRDEHGALIDINLGDTYEGKPYMETCIALEGIFPSRG